MFTATASDFSDFSAAASATDLKDSAEEVLCRVLFAVGAVPNSEIGPALMRAHFAFLTLEGRSKNEQRGAKLRKDKAAAKQASTFAKVCQRMANVAIIGHDEAVGAGKWFPGAARKRTLARIEAENFAAQITNPICASVAALRESVESAARIGADAALRAEQAAERAEKHATAKGVKSAA